MSDRFPNAPAKIKALKTDERGFPVPWFVAWIDGKADFRIIGPRKIEWAVKYDSCWICGTKLGRFKTFVIGPMCAVNRVSSEPPSHLECAEFAAKNCPFLANPRMRRNEKGAEDFKAPAGQMIKRNPGVALVWSTLRYRRFSDGNGGVLFDVGRPERVGWYAHGREATNMECMNSIMSGLPLLHEMAAKEGQAAIDQLNEMTLAAMKLLPRHTGDTLTPCEFITGAQTTPSMAVK